MPVTEIDLENIVAIDVHTHVQASVEAGRWFPDDSPEAAVAQVFGSDALLTVPELAAFYRERNMAAVCFMVDSVRWGGPETSTVPVRPSVATRSSRACRTSLRRRPARCPAAQCPSTSMAR